MIAANVPQVPDCPALFHIKLVLRKFVCKNHGFTIHSSLVDARLVREVTKLIRKCQMPQTEIQRRQQQQPGFKNPNPRNGAWNPVRHAQEPRSAPNWNSSNGSGMFKSNNRFEHQQQQRYAPSMYKNSNRMEQQHHKEVGIHNLNRKPQLFIRYAEMSIRRAFVASVDPGVSWSTTLLKFQPFSATDLAHLSGESLYTLALCPSPGLVRERSAELYTQACTDYEKLCPTSKPLSAQEVADSVIDNLYAEMSTAMDYARSYLESRFWVGVKPKLWLRFGRILFHSRQNRSNLASHKPFDAEGLERSLHGPKNEDSVLKTFDSGVSHDYYRKIRALIGGDGLEVPETKEKFIVQVADATQPRYALICTCRRSFTSDGPRVTLCKVRTEPLRHMVADFACMEQELDLRLILTTRQEFKGDTRALQAIIDKAVYDVKAEGGLSWPLGSTSSGPYTVMGASYVMQTNLKSQGCKWKLRHASRTSLNASAARFSYEVDVTTDEWTDQFQVWKNLYEKESTRENCQYVDCFFRPFSTLFSWVWANCI